MSEATDPEYSVAQLVDAEPSTPTGGSGTVVVVAGASVVVVSGTVVVGASVVVVSGTVVVGASVVVVGASVVVVVVAGVPGHRLLSTNLAGAERAEVATEPGRAHK